MSEQIKQYTCECGKEYTNSQAFNGHKSSCKIHLESVGKSITKSSAHNLAIRAKSGATRSKRLLERQKQQELQWIAEKHSCERCGKIMTEKYATGRFCSQACANSRTKSKQTREKVSTTLKQTYLQVKEIKSAATKPLSQYQVSRKTITKIISRMEVPCSCCGSFIPGIPWDLHHIIPRHCGGSDFADNLTYICPNCHRICHINPAQLPKELISLDDFFELQGKNWQDYCSIKFKER